MIKVITSAERHTSERGWIHSEFSFSFADYDDPSNAHFGCLLAHNDNQLGPKQGFKKHPHHDLEIVSYVISGTLEHDDDMGNTTQLEAGTVQVMSAGTGINHSEKNPSEEEPVRFLQMWFLPSEPGLEPTWKSSVYSKADRTNKLVPVVSGRSHQEGGALSIQQDVDIYLPILETGHEFVFPQQEHRRTYLFLISGHLEIGCNDGTFQLEPGDAARIHNSCDLHIKGTSSEGQAEFVLVDIP
ncbi:pirin family protein [Paenibacillus pini]|uniref:YhhW family protein n=1 Tax=Paenibacillus pini JCM 16418 TaxID=1236976 RepID=W7Z7X6_9BACL|nr:pirin-like bicupin family protein [Paenibacillus pini]GAF10509.1 YhhW family protein [Paenibacillus pini JCM 16418]